METLIIRKAHLDDAPALADLSGQLGYPQSANSMRQSLVLASRRSDLIIFVALADSQVVGFAAVSRRNHFIVPEHTELEALIVDEHHRSLGVGAALVRAAENWTGEHGLTTLRVRSREMRVRAHTFYLREGYIHTKTQLVFEKQIQSVRSF